MLSRSVTKSCMPAPGLAAPLQLLRCNAALPGGVRYALVGDRSSLQLRTDIPWAALIAHGSTLLAARVDQALLGFSGAPVCSPAPSHDAAREDDIDAADNDAESDFDSWLESLCDEAGWQASRKGSDDARGEVASSDGCGVVAITRAGSRTLFRANLSCVELPADDSDCSRAIGLLLLRVTGGVRMCRPVLTSREDRSVLHFEVVFSETPMVAGEVDCALGALSAAAEECLREVELLSANPHLAHIYLAAWKQRRPGTPLACKREQQ